MKRFAGFGGTKGAGRGPSEERRDTGAEARGKRGGDAAERALFVRKREFQRAGVEQKPAFLKTAAVFPVPGQGIPVKRGVGSDLVGFSRADFRPRKGISAGGGQGNKAGFRRASLWGYAGFAGAKVPLKRLGADRLLFKNAVKKRQIPFLYPPLPRQGAENPGAFQTGGERDNPACGGVQAVQRPGPERKGGRYPVRKVRPRRNLQTVGAVGPKAGGFIEKEKPLSFPKHAKTGGRRVVYGSPRRFRAEIRRRNNRSGGKAGVRSRNLSVHQHHAFPQYPMYPREGHIWQRFPQYPVKPAPRVIGRRGEFHRRILFFSHFSPFFLFSPKLPAPRQSGRAVLNINVLPQNINVLSQNINVLPRNINVLPRNITLPAERL
jgi:hypothetical protein